MFTGLIEAVGCVAEVQRTASGLRLRVETSLAGELNVGDSVAMNGVCLTVVSTDGGHIACDVGPETATVTTLGAARRGQAVNLERPVRADGRFGGHFVQGHVDSTGLIRQLRQEGDAHWLTVSFKSALAPYLIPRGSIAVDGISLTIAALGASTFEVMIIPHTWHHTNLQRLGTGDSVNLECDMIGKYVARTMELAAKTAALQGR